MPDPALRDAAGAIHASRAMDHLVRFATRLDDES